MLVNKVGVWTDWPSLHWLLAGAERDWGSPGTPGPSPLWELRWPQARRTGAEHNHAPNTVMRGSSFIMLLARPTSPLVSNK